MIFAFGTIVGLLLIIVYFLNEINENLKEKNEKI